MDWTPGIVVGLFVRVVVDDDGVRAISDGDGVEFATSSSATPEKRKFDPLALTTQLWLPRYPGRVS